MNKYHNGALVSDKVTPKPEPAPYPYERHVRNAEALKLAFANLHKPWARRWKRLNNEWI